MRPLLLLVPLWLTVALVAPLAQPGSAAAQAGEVEIEIVDFAFSPATIEIPVGTTVTWTNAGQAPHTVTADDGSFDSGRLRQGDSFSLRFDEPGTYAYHCDIHPRMRATIVVTGEEALEPEPMPTEAPSGEENVVGVSVAGGNALEFVGKIDQDGTNFAFYGYFTYIAGLEPATLFLDPDPANWSEATARFTFFGSATLTSRWIIDQQLFVVTAEGTEIFYFNDQGGASFDAPESFFGGTAIAEAQVRLRNVLTVVEPAKGVADGTGEVVVSRVTPFDLGGETYQLGVIGSRQRVAFSAIGHLLEPTEPRAVLAMAGHTASSAAASAPETVPVAEQVPEVEPGTLVFQLLELNDSGISGTATLTDEGAQTTITLALAGAISGHPVHIHRGTCDNLDPNPAYPLTTVDETGRSVTTVDVTADELTGGEYAINVHLSLERIGIYVACGDLS